MNTKQTAIKWYVAGYATIPIGYRSKRPCIQSWQEFQTRLPTIQEIESWYNGLFNIALVCGHGLVVIDFDEMPAYNEWKMKTNISTYEVTTRRGVHVYVKLLSPPPFTLKWAGGDIKVNGYVLIPPSTHPTGHKYKALNNQPIAELNALYDVLPYVDFDDVGKSDFSFTPQKDSIFAPRDTGQYDKFNRLVSIAQSFTHYQSESGKFIRVKCPFHDDKNASAWVNVESNRFGCHACINGSISAIDFYTRKNGTTAQYEMEMFINSNLT